MEQPKNTQTGEGQPAGAGQTSGQPQTGAGQSNNTAGSGTNPAGQTGRQTSAPAGQPQGGAGDIDPLSYIPAKFVRQVGDKRELNYQGMGKAWQDNEVSQSRLYNENLQLKQELDRLRAEGSKPGGVSGRPADPLPENIFDVNPNQLMSKIDQIVDQRVSEKMRPVYEDRERREVTEANNALNDVFSTNEAIKNYYGNQELFTEDVRRVILSQGLNQLQVSPKDLVRIATNSLLGERFTEMQEYAQLKGAENAVRNRQHIDNAWVETGGIPETEEQVILNDADRKLGQAMNWDEKKLRQVKLRKLKKDALTKGGK